MTVSDFTIRIVFSIFLGFLIGIERQLTGSPAGIRTNILVCLGATMFGMFPVIIEGGDPTRVAAQIVSGVGFLCSGIIFKDGVNVRGLSTAATIWCTAAIGVLGSSGQLRLAFTATLLLLLTNIVSKPIADRISLSTQFDEAEKYYKVSVTCRENKEMFIRALIMEYIAASKMLLTNLESSDIAEDKVKIEAKLVCYGKRKDDITEKLISRISNEQDVTSVGWEVT